LALHVPPLLEIASLFKDALLLNFSEVEVEVVSESPDLTQAPWNLAGKGLTGNCRLLDIGGELNLFHAKNHAAVYDFVECAKVAENPGAFMIGPGAASRSVIGKNCELMANVNIKEDKYLSYYSVMQDDNITPKTAPYSSHEIGILLNLLACDGIRGSCVHVRAAQRKGELNFVSCLRQGLRKYYTEKNLTVGIGGTFQLSKGSIKSHVMPDFVDKDMTAEECGRWLKYFESHAPLTCLSTFVTDDLHNNNLRLEHTHFFSDHGEGGHYHYDITPETVEYEGYFVPCKSLYRIGRPQPNPMC